MGCGGDHYASIAFKRAKEKIHLQNRKRSFSSLKKRGHYVIIGL
jgi:hypothetical protein